ncbi:sigma-54-dependent Fis family transcriptional regulator [candidate division KSB1 bacterium]|nr:sigma-54-dependent Fis family transcriptional regulator [candidate division KSB1 bacterium]
MAKILVIDDESIVRTAVTHLLKSDGHEVDQTGSGIEALKMAESEIYDLVLCDLIMDGMNGITILKRFKQLSQDVEFIIITAFATIDTAIEALRNGAYHYLVKPVNDEELLLTVRKAIERNELRMKVRRLENQLRTQFGHDDFIAVNPAMQRIIQNAMAVANTESNIIINGESGTGKEVMANVIHNASLRSTMPFVAVNCAAMPESLLESELFGHVRGAFTGATNTKRGLLEEANGGTLFLDEIAETTLEFQAKLLRFSQFGEIRRVGSNTTHKVNVRVISATNKNLKQAMLNNEFREDLYYRLAVIPIHIPPLRDRIEDISVLAQHFLQLQNKKYESKKYHFSNAAITVLNKYEWPGNVRELMNAVEYSCAICGGDTIEVQDLPFALQSQSELVPGFRSETNRTLDEMTKQYILHVLQETNWHQKKACQILGLSKTTLYRRLQQYGIKAKLMMAGTGS